MVDIDHRHALTPAPPRRAREHVPFEDLRRTPLGRIDRGRAAAVAHADVRDEGDHGRIGSATFGSSI